MIATSNSETDRADAHAGFTLIELLVVLSIVALLSAVAVAGFSRQSKWRGRNEVARVLDAMSVARARAILTGRTTKIDDAAIPNGARFATSDGLSPLWFADGTAHEAQLKRDGHILLEVNPMTGLGREVP